jgi:hypothetical protein
LIGALDEVITKSAENNQPPPIPAISTNSGPLNQSISQNDRSAPGPAPQYAKKYMNDVRNITALKMTEVYEWSLEKGLERQHQAAASSSSSSSASSLVNMLGIRKTEQLSNNPLAMLPLARPSSDSVLKSRTYLCSYKFRYAMVLCDFGLTAEALEYALDIKNFINFVNQKADPMDPKKGRPPTNPKTGGAAGATNECPTPSKPQPFSKGFVNTVNEFVDRLSGGNSKNDSTGSGQGSAGSSSSGTGSSSWNVWSMLNSANLKDLVDGPTERNPTASQQQPPPQSSQKMGPPPLSSSGPPSNSSSGNNPNGNRSLPSQNDNSLPPPPTMPSYSKQPPSQFSNHGPPPLMMPGSSPYPSGPNHSSAMGPPGLKSSSSTGDLRDNFSLAPPIDNSLAAMGHSSSNPGSHSGSAVPSSHPQHRKQHSADATPQPSKTSPSKVGATKKGSESDKNIITSVTPPPPSLRFLTPLSAGQERVTWLAVSRCSRHF